MKNYQEAKKSTSAAPPKSAAKTQSKASEQKATLCPNCGASVPEGAIFCPECGFSLNAPIFCPNCGAETTPDADICQTCGAWLLDGQCMFCYAPLDPSAAFCADCGNPKDGIKCPDCGSLSIFDFCSKCGRPLTEGAAIALELAKSDPDAKSMLDSVQETIALEAKLAEMDALINSAPVFDPSPDDNSGSDDNTPAPPPVKKSLFSDSQLSAIMKTAENREAAVVRQAEAAKRAEEFERKQEEEKKRKQAAEAQKARELARKQEEERRAQKEALERQLAMVRAEFEEAKNRFRKKTFLTHQDARRFHNALKPAGVNVSGWLCNAYDNVHSCPNECANPSLGGMWV